jgi:hypothetical protein
MKGAKNRQEGQNLLEFSLIFFILIIIVLGIIGFGLIFNAHLNLNMAVNSAARSGSVIDYSLFDPNESYDQPIYDELVGNLVLLSAENVVDITIYRPEADGSIGSMKNVLDGDGNLVSENYTNASRVMDTEIGVQVRYTQPVIVPIVSLITGQQMQIIKRASFRLE